MDCSSGAQQVMVDLSPPNGSGRVGARDCLSPTRGLGKGLCFTLGSGEEQGLERGLKGQGSAAGPAQARGLEKLLSAPAGPAACPHRIHCPSLGTLGPWTSLCLSLSQLLAGATCSVQSIITQAHS